MGRSRGVRRGLAARSWAATRRVVFDAIAAAEARAADVVIADTGPAGSTPTET